MVELVSIRYLSDREEITASGFSSTVSSRDQLAEEESSGTIAQEDTQNELSNSTTTCTRICCSLKRDVSSVCHGCRALPWSYVVLGTIMFIVASIMSIPLLVFYATSVSDQQNNIECDHHL